MILAPKFCSQCGQPAGGNFCSACGHKLISAADEGPISVGCWQEEINYQVLLRVPEVRERIERATNSAEKKMTGEEFLAIADKLNPIGVPMETVLKVAMPFYKKLGIGTAKQRTETIPVPAGETIARLLISLARQRQSIDRVEQGDQGCVFHAKFPSTIWAFAGDLTVSLHRQQLKTQVTASARVHGQLVDWGKCEAVLNTLFQDLSSDAA